MPELGFRIITYVSNLCQTSKQMLDKNVYGRFKDINSRPHNKLVVAIQTEFDGSSHIFQGYIL